jgi:hypothetical protein
MPSKEICAATRATYEKCSGSNEENYNEDVADNCGAADRVELGGDGGIERIAGVEDCRYMGIIHRIARAHRFKNGIVGEGKSIRIVDMYDTYNRPRSSRLVWSAAKDMRSGR